MTENAIVDDSFRYQTKAELLACIEDLNKKNTLLKSTIVNLSVELNQYKTKEDGMLFCEFIMQWLEHHRKNIKANTFDAYSLAVKVHIYPFFKQRGIHIDKLTSKDIQDFYDIKSFELSGKTISNIHTCLHSSLRYACINGIIKNNPSENVELPRKVSFKASYYKDFELRILIEKLEEKNSPILTPVMLASFLGLRRSEILGIRWSNINFEDKTLLISRTVVRLVSTTGVLITDTTKTKSSFRTMPIPQVLYEHLCTIKSINDILFIDSPDKDYICLNNKGKLMSPDYVSRTFKKFLKENQLRVIRFHDLRHSCASILLSLGFSLKQIQDWLGHSNIQSTMIYTHLGFEAKLPLADAIQNQLKHK